MHTRIPICFICYEFRPVSQEEPALLAGSRMAEIKFITNGARFSGVFSPKIGTSRSFSGWQRTLSDNGIGTERVPLNPWPQLGALLKEARVTSHRELEKDEALEHVSRPRCSSGFQLAYLQRARSVMAVKRPSPMK